jgi:hypothetical protein
MAGWRDGLPGDTGVTSEGPTTSDARRPTTDQLRILTNELTNPAMVEGDTQPILADISHA